MTIENDKMTYQKELKLLVKSIDQINERIEKLETDLYGFIKFYNDKADKAEKILKEHPFFKKESENEKSIHPSP